MLSLPTLKENVLLTNHKPLRKLASTLPSFPILRDHSFVCSKHYISKPKSITHFLRVINLPLTYLRCIINKRKTMNIYLILNASKSILSKHYAYAFQKVEHYWWSPTVSHIINIIHNFLNLSLHYSPNNPLYNINTTHYRIIDICTKNPSNSTTHTT